MKITIDRIAGLIILSAFILFIVQAVTHTMPQDSGPPAF
jgi:hypothetical protein